MKRKGLLILTTTWTTEALGYVKEDRRRRLVVNDPNYMKFPAQGLFGPWDGVGGWLKRGMKEPLGVMEMF